MTYCKYIKDENCYYGYDDPPLDACKFCWDVRGKWITVFGPIIRDARETMAKNEKLTQENEQLKREKNAK